MNNPNDPQAVLSGLTITTTDNTGPAIAMNGSSMTLNTSASIQIGSITLTEDMFIRMEAALEFVERFAAEHDEARAVWTAIKAKRRILK